MRTSIITLLFILLSTVGFSQVIGGRDNSEMTPQVAEATKLSGGGFVGDVNIMTGEYGASIPLGTVGTPSGLSYSLELNYSSAFTFGTVQPRTAGIPYGEGWSPNIPTVSVETDVFHKFWCWRMQNDGSTYSLNFNNWTHDIDSTDYRGRDEGDLYWFAPVVSIPGVGSGRAVFKYVDTDDDNCVVFVLNKFEQPIEIRYYGNDWVVKAPDGTRYEFSTHLANYRAPSNQRVLHYDQSNLAVYHDNEMVANTGSYSVFAEDVQNVIEPKASYSVWYCDKIFNTMYPMQWIHFDYDEFGEFNYFQEFDQVRYEQVRSDVFYTSTNTDYKAFTDIHLLSVRSEVIDSDLDIIELEYKTLNSALNQSGMLDHRQSGVDRLDSLYSFQVVEKWYEGNSNNLTGWKRYKHYAHYNPSTNTVNPVNPYLNPTTDYYHRTFHNGTQDVPFNHGFLESPRVSTNSIFPGDIYEIRTVISRTDGTDLDNGNGTVDISINTGNRNAYTYSTSTIQTKSAFESMKGNEIFSTFNSAMKWQMGYGQSILNTSNFFVMPNVSSEHGGFNVQIGPGNSDMDFGAVSDFNNPFVTNNVPDVRDVYPFNIQKADRDVPSTANIPHNFGTGYPWGMMIPVFNKIALSGETVGSSSAASDSVLYETWWSNGTLNYPNRPTRFDSTVVLDSVELIRYSKNPYMLQGVRVYKVNGNYGQYQDSIMGRELVSHKQLEYEIKSPYVLKNNFYDTGDTLKYEGYKRHIILLSRVREIPIDGELYAANYGVSDTSKVLTTFLGYEDIFEGEVYAAGGVYDELKPYLGQTHYALTSYTDHLGGITAVQYHTFRSGNGSRFFSNYTRNSCGDYLYSSSSTPEPFGRNASYSAHPAVRYMVKNDESNMVGNPVVSPFGGSYIIHKRWEYVYDTDSVITNPKKFELWQGNFRKDYFYDKDFAFGNVRVYEPYFDDSTRSYTDYAYYGCKDGTPTKEEYLYYGKLKSAKTYKYVDGASDILHEEKFVNYGHTLAFKNGWTRPNYLRENLGYDDLIFSDYEYKDIYLNDELTVDYFGLSFNDTTFYDSIIGDTITTFIVDTTWTYNATGAEARRFAAPRYITGNYTDKEQPKFLEFFFYDSLLAYNPEFMLQSYFIKKTSEISRTYDKLLSKSTSTGTNPPVVAPNLENNPYGGDIANPISNTPGDSVLIQKINIDRNESIDDLMAASPLSDTVLAHLLNSSIVKEKQANVLAYQQGLSNDIWQVLVDKMGTFAPKSMENIIRMQPYFSDSMQLYLIDAVDSESDADLFVMAMTKNLYLTNDVVIALMNTSEFPGQSVGDILEVQPQQTEALLDTIIASSNLSSTNLTRVLQNQYMSDARFEQILDNASYYEDNITDLFELTVSFPTDSVLISVANEMYTAANAERIMDAANRNLSQAVIDVIETNYSRRDAGKIIPNLTNTNALAPFCNNPVTESRDYIETKTEYEYYEADYTGLSVGKAHDILMGHRSSVDDPSPFPITLDATNMGGDGDLNTGFVIDSLRLKHEPSWQVFSVKTTSPHHPNAYSREEYFYLYDLQNRYDRYWYNYDLDSNVNLSVTIYKPGTSYTDTLVIHDEWHNYYQGIDPSDPDSRPMLRQHDGMERSRTHGNKVLAFQKTAFTKNSRDDDPLTVSEYYQYDRRWEFDDLPTTALPDTFDFGDSCQYIPNNTPTSIDDCEDCYEIFYKPYMDPVDITPTYHCLWFIPGYGMYICDSDIDWATIDTTATLIYCDSGYDPADSTKYLPYGLAMSKALLLRDVTVQVDTFKVQQEFLNERMDTKNTYVAEFFLGDPGIEDSLGFKGKHHMVYPYDHLTVRTIKERNRYLQPELEENQIGLLTRYEYNKSTRYVNYNENCTSDSYGSTLNKDIGLPIRITVGHTKSDSISTAYAYNDIGQVQKVTSPSGKYMEYSFDNYYRLDSITENGTRLLSDFSYHNWLQEDTLDFRERTEENWVQTTLYNSDLQKDSLDYEFRKAFLDPLARNQSVVSAYWSTPYNLRQIHSGSVQYDNWGRTTHAYKNFTVDQLLIKDSINFSMPFAESIYENDPKARALRTSNYGVDVLTNPVVKSDYCLTNNVFTSCELELSFTELPLIMGPGATADYRFYRTEVQDQDDKRSIEYINALGQKVATLKYNNQNEKIITLFVYDSYGNIVQVINPEKQDNTFAYNMLGQLVKETSVDAGTKRYMYNKQGLVSVDQDQNARTHTIGDSLAPYYRVYDYDDYGRLISVGRKETGFPYANSNIYDPLYYETVLIDDALGYNWIDTAHYFDYTFTNASSQDWLTSFKVWDTISTSGTTLYDSVEVTGFNTQFAATALEKEFVYGGNTPYNTIGQVVESYSYDDEGVKVQGTTLTYDTLDRLASQTVTFDPVGIDDTTGNLVSIIDYPAYNYRGSLMQEMVDVNGDSTVDFHCFMTYDYLNRLSSIRASAGEVDSLELATLLVSYTYDDANGVVDKKKHFIDDDKFGIISRLVNEIEYDFDVRDRLTEIQVGQLSLGLDPLMQYSMYYDDQTPYYTDDTTGNLETVNFSNNYNGNINGTLMKYDFYGTDVNTNISTFDKPTLYGYTYDKINRLTNADATVGDYLVAAGNPDYAISYQIGDLNTMYDRIGNIETLYRMLRNAGGGSYAEIQQYDYSYQAGNNRLLEATGLNGTTTRNYTYDANGNLLKDNFRDIDSTVYGRAAYPYHIDLGGQQIDYLYSVDDQRMYKYETETADTTETYYLMDAMGKTVAIYTQNTTADGWEYFISGAERECRLTPRSGQEPGSNASTTLYTDLTFEMDQASFYYYDHLGNTRMVCMPDTMAADTVVHTISFVADYYPYGKVLREYSGTDEERYLTTQHERDRNTGLDYRGARYYDSDMARFLSLDPLAVNYPSLSDYSYVAGNPIIYTDPNGKEIRDANGNVISEEKSETGWTANHAYLNSVFGSPTGVAIEYYEGDGDDEKKHKKRAGMSRKKEFPKKSATNKPKPSGTTNGSNLNVVNKKDHLVGYYYYTTGSSLLTGGSSKGTLITMHKGKYKMVMNNFYNKGGFIASSELMNFGVGYGVIASTGPASEVPLSAIEGFSYSFRLNASAIIIDGGTAITISPAYNEQGDYLMIFDTQLSMGLSTKFVSGGISRTHTNLY